MDGIQAFVKNDTIESTFVSIDNLTPFTNYSFSVSASTRSGVGPASIAVNFLTEDGG